FAVHTTIASTSLCFCVLRSRILGGPPRPTLFPYTTLFRSGHHPHRGGDRPAAGQPQHHRRGPARAGHHQGRLRLRWCPARAGPRDRKSTRLNSSHVKISYAVFGLKKKKKKRDHSIMTSE